MKVWRRSVSSVASAACGSTTRSRGGATHTSSTFSPLTYREGSEVGAALGAARLARLAVSGDRVEEVCVAPPRERVVEPQAALATLLAERRHTIPRLYHDLKSSFEEYPT